MTATVTIHAHPAENREVRVLVEDGFVTIERITLQAGETVTRPINDGRSIHIQEITK